jgi:hypothetical protein
MYKTSINKNMYLQTFSRLPPSVDRSLRFLASMQGWDRMKASNIG